MESTEKSKKHKDKKDEDRKRRIKPDDDDHDDDSSSSSRDRRRKKRKSKRSKKRRKRASDSSSDQDSSDDDPRKSSRRRRKSKSKYRRSSKRGRRRKRDSSSSSSSDDSSESNKLETTKKVSTKLLAKLSARGETLEEREERRAQRRAARITAKFGYTAEDNPFNDPNLHETFTWNKKIQETTAKSRTKQQDEIFEEIQKVRKRRQDREEQFQEMERIRADEQRMRELENYDKWQQKEEQFHLQQQRQRSAIRLVEGREKPIDVLAKNLLMFGLSSDDKDSGASVKYQERYNALEQLQTLEAELEEPYKLLRKLKKAELNELLEEIHAFQKLEREATTTISRGVNDSTILRYWDALDVVTTEEIEYLTNGGNGSSYAKKVQDVQTIFKDQSITALTQMKGEIEQKLRASAAGGTSYGLDTGAIDRNYWQLVLRQLQVHMAKMELANLHSKMLVQQLEKLEQRKLELSKKQERENNHQKEEQAAAEEEEEPAVKIPDNVPQDFGDLDEELGLANEVDIGPEQAANYSWSDKYRPRKPRYFNRVKTGYDWNKYNQTHYDHDNPPPKTVQGYKFNIFYPDLVDPTKTPQYFLEPADTDDFCIIRFHAGPPYEDIAFRIVNREWNRSRKRGFRCTFERGVLSLYFNFTTYWYRR